MSNYTYAVKYFAYKICWTTVGHGLAEAALAHRMGPVHFSNASMVVMADCQGLVKAYIRSPLGDRKQCCSFYLCDGYLGLYRY